MGKMLQATDFVTRDPAPVAPCCALVGDDAFLVRQALDRIRRETLGADDAEFSQSNFEGADAELRDVLGALETVGMFGGGRRLVVVREADAARKNEDSTSFVSRHREALERYVARPATRGVLVLTVRTLPTSTRLHKLLLEHGVLIECKAPKEGALKSWLVAWAKRAHDLHVSGAAVEQMLETIGPELGLLEQELSKLANVVGGDRRVGPELVRQYVGGWRARSTWDMLDAALSGNAAEAMRQLERLLASGEQPVALLAQIAGSLRRLAAATRLIVDSETQHRRLPIREALEQVGVKPSVLAKVEGQLRRLGRARGLQLYDWLLEADLDLKGESQQPPRLILEQLIVRLATPAARAGAS